MEPDQAGAVESPCSLLSHRSVHGLFIGRKRRITPTRRERVEQARPLLWSVSCSLLLPPVPLPSASTPIKGGLWPPTGGLADRDGDAGEALEFACKGKCLLSRDQPHLFDRLTAPPEVLNGAGHSAALFDTGRIAMDDQQADIADGALWSCHGNFGEEPPGHAPRRSSRQGWRSHLRSPFLL